MVVDTEGEGEGEVDGEGEGVGEGGSSSHPSVYLAFISAFHAACP